jgi:FkbM family methyltransferase
MIQLKTKYQEVYFKEMTHKFDAKNKHKLDNENRRELLPPEETLIKLGLHEGDVMADIGCGIGYFTIPASKIVGDNGKVFAMDILPEMLQDVGKKIKDNNISNIEIILTEENDLKLEDNKVTFAFISTVLHEADEKENFLNEIKRIISPKGRIAIVEWQKINSEFGPPIEHRLDKVDLIKILDTVGFSNISTIDIGENFYGLIAEK